VKSSGKSSAEKPSEFKKPKNTEPAKESRSHTGSSSKDKSRHPPKKEEKKVSSSEPSASKESSSRESRN